MVIILYIICIYLYLLIHYAEYFPLFYFYFFIRIKRKKKFKMDYNYKFIFFYLRYLIKNIKIFF